MSLQNLKTTRRLFLKSSGAFGLIGAANMALAGDRFLPSQNFLGNCRKPEKTLASAASVLAAAV